MTIEQDIINGISNVIANDKRALHAEYTHPSRSGDEMDDEINRLRNKIKALRECRTRLEIAFYGEGEGV